MSTLEERNKVILLYSKLDNYDRARVREFIDDFEKKNDTEKKVIGETLNKSFTSGPLSGKCPSCGK